MDNPIEKNIQIWRIEHISHSKYCFYKPIQYYSMEIYYK